MDKLIENLTQWGKKNRTLYWLVFGITFGLILRYELYKKILHTEFDIFVILIETALVSGGITKFLEHVNFPSFFLRLPIVSDVIFWLGSDVRPVLKELKNIHSSYRSALNVCKQNKDFLENKNSKGVVTFDPTGMGLLTLSNYVWLHDFFLAYFYQKFFFYDMNNIFYDLARTLEKEIFPERELKIRISNKQATTLFNTISYFLERDYIVSCTARVKTSNGADKAYSQDVIINKQNKDSIFHKLNEDIVCHAIKLNPAVVRFFDIREYGFFWQRNTVVAHLYFLLMHFPLVFLFWKG